MNIFQERRQYELLILIGYQKAALSNMYIISKFRLARIIKKFTVIFACFFSVVIVNDTHFQHSKE